MTQIAFSELTKSFYFLPVKGSKIDITNDIKEIVFAHTSILEKKILNMRKEISELQTQLDR